MKATCKKEELEDHADDIFKDADVDADKLLTVDEVEKYLSEKEGAWAKWFLTDDYFYDWRPEKAERKIMSAELLRNRAEDTVAYHDVDGDGKASEEEVLASL